jgi:hypothetical protein
MENKQIREHLIDNGVRNLMANGFKNVTKENIIKNEKYREEFKFLLIKEIGSNDGFRDMVKNLLPEIFKY